jgi:LysM repeat protein
MSSRRQRLVVLAVCGLAVAISAGLARYKLDGVRPIELTHTVRKGDTLWAISKQHGVSVKAIKEANRLKGDTIEVGQELVIPGVEAGEASQAPRDMSPTTTRLRPQAVPEAAPPASGLTMPAPQPCIAAPSMVDEGLELDEATMAASEGLAPQAARSAVRAFLPQMARCVGEIGDRGGTVELELTVACSGQVAEVVVADGDGLPQPLVDCIAETARYVPFPAHGLPDGDRVRWPVQVSPP